MGVSLATLGPVFLRARPFGLVAACPYRLRRGIRRQFAPAHPPVHLTRGSGNLFCQLLFFCATRHPLEIYCQLVYVFSSQPLNFSTFQRLFSGAPTQVLDSCNSSLSGCTQEGVTEDRRAVGRGIHPPSYYCLFLEMKFGIQNRTDIDARSLCWTCVSSKGPREVCVSSFHVS